MEARSFVKSTWKLLPLKKRSTTLRVKSSGSAFRAEILRVLKEDHAEADKNLREDHAEADKNLLKGRPCRS